MPETNARGKCLPTHLPLDNLILLFYNSNDTEISMCNPKTM